ncbi:hypothetical protein JOE61_000281 [Nocardioides salarius]|uniref:YobI-like P-loop NTPase domain-containing protein n=1 Tax=Nocardioides salarius TaxID=374513 RepID=A0ABS2M5J8_9ACTN|nr:hypothetical protein [Nocardioides salarius]MBM7506467.1 hypothetical protein [Nocardioides salarius]
MKRANRTKFFEVVIPVVPFISHRTARDHVLDALDHLGFPNDAVDRRLLDLVARHATEMRLLLNVCNEFAVYAEKLLWVPKPAPGMTNEHLFALVAYKNFHLTDFEGIPQRASALDRLEGERLALVRHCIEQAQRNKRAKKTAAARQRAQVDTAAKIGARLLGLVAGTHAVAPQQRRQVSIIVGGQDRPEDEVTTVTFWKDVAAERSLTITRYGVGAILVLSDDVLRNVFSEALTPNRWEPLNETELRRELSKYDAQVALLQGASYAELAKHTEFQNEAGKSFAEVIDELLTSELARDLVKRGYLTHNFAEYSATFYGKFIGTDVAHFYNRSVQPNQVMMDFRFDSPASVKNLLEEAPSDFTTTRSAFNIDLVSYLLREERPEMDVVADFIVSELNTDARAFLSAFLNDVEAPCAELITELTFVPWSDVFEYLVAEESLPDDETRLRLFDAALLASEDSDEYAFGEAPSEYLRENHPSLVSFTAWQTETTAERVFAFARRASLKVANLGALERNPALRDRVIGARAYELSATNLRSALGVEGPVGVEEAKGKDDVWAYCAASLPAYLQALREDEQTEFAVRTEPTLIEVLTNHHDGWEEDEVSALLELTSPDASVGDLETVPPGNWTSVVAADRLRLNVANLVTYTTEHDVNQALAGLLVPAEGQPRTLEVEEDASQDDRLSLAVTLLNADLIVDVAARVGLVAQLGLPPRSLPVTDIASRPPRLLGLLLGEELVADDEATFRHFLNAGWEAVEDALGASSTAESFFRPDLFASVAGGVLTSRVVPDEFKQRVLDDLDLFVLDGDANGLKSAASFAVAMDEKLPLARIQRIARETQDVEKVSRLLVRVSRDISTEQLVDTLVMLGGELAALTNGPGSTFPYPESDALDTLFGRLKREGRIKVTSKMFKKTVENRA